MTKRRERGTHVVFQWRLALRDDPRLPATAKHVGLTLAIYVNRYGEAWPSIDRLAGDTRRNPRTVQRALRQLEGAGYVKTVKGGGRGRTSHYLCGFPEQKGGVAPPYQRSVAWDPGKGGDADRKGGVSPPELEIELVRELGPDNLKCEECHGRPARLYQRSGHTEAFCDEHGQGFVLAEVNGPSELSPSTEGIEGEQPEA